MGGRVRAKTDRGFNQGEFTFYSDLFIRGSLPLLTITTNMNAENKEPQTVNIAWAVDDGYINENRPQDLDVDISSCKTFEEFESLVLEEANALKDEMGIEIHSNLEEIWNEYKNR